MIAVLVRHGLSRNYKLPVREVTNGGKYQKNPQKCFMRKTTDILVSEIQDSLTPD